jgi:NADH-quinone oxidoreductase subunit C
MIEIIRERFGNNIRDISAVGKNIYVDIQTDYIRKACGFLYKYQNMRFITITAVDEKDSIELIYHFSDDKNGNTVNIKIVTDSKESEADTITDLIRGACWAEKEATEMFGVKFLDSEDTGLLFLSNKKRSVKYPMRKID